MVPQNMFPRFPFLSGANLLKWRHCCLVQVFTSFRRANSHIVSFCKLALSENRTCISKTLKQGWINKIGSPPGRLSPYRLGCYKIVDAIWMSIGSVADCFSLTETGSQTDSVTPVEPAFCPGHMGSHHHTFALFVLCGWWTDTRLLWKVIIDLWTVNKEYTVWV